MNQTDAWLALLCGLVVAYRHDDANKKALAQHLENLLDEAAPAFVAMGANKKTGTKAKLRTAIAVVATGKTSRNGMPSPVYARALLAIRNDLKGDARRRALYKTYVTGPDVNKRQQSLANLAIALLVPDTETVERRFGNLDKMLSILPDRIIKTSTVQEVVVNEQPQHLREIRHLVNKFVGRSDTHLTDVERKEAKEASPERYKRYLELHRKVGEVWKGFIRNLVRSEGRQITIKEAAQALKEAKIEHHSLDGLIQARLGGLKLDEDCKLYTPDNRKLNGGIPPIGSRISVNTAYTPQSDTFYFRFIVPGSETKGTKVYRADSQLASKEEGTQKIIDSIPVVVKSRPKWVQDLMGNNTMKRTLGAMVEIIWELVPRIGSPGNKTGNKETQGFSTLKVANVTINGNVMILNYVGKAAQKQRHVLKAKTPEHLRALAVVQRLMRGKNKQDWLWTDPNGKRIGGSDVNAYLRTMKIPITIHEFRDVRGTQLMQSLLDKAKIPANATENQVAAKVKELAINVGTLLGHQSGQKVTPMTSIKSYIVPKVIADFFKARNLRIPDWVPTAGRGDGSVAPRPVVKIGKTEVNSQGRTPREFTPKKPVAPISRKIPQPAPVARHTTQPSTPGTRRPSPNKLSSNPFRRFSPMIDSD